MLLLPPTGGVPPLPVFYSTIGTTGAPRAWSTKSTSPWTSSWRCHPSWMRTKTAYGVLRTSSGGMPTCLASRTTLHQCVANATIGASALKRQRRPPPSHSSRPPLHLSRLACSQCTSLWSARRTPLGRARPVDPWRNVSFLQGEGAG